MGEAMSSEPWTSSSRRAVQPVPLPCGWQWERGGGRQYATCDMRHGHCDSIERAIEVGRAGGYNVVTQSHGHGQQPATHESCRHMTASTPPPRRPSQTSQHSVALAALPCPTHTLALALALGHTHSSPAAPTWTRCAASIRRCRAQSASPTSTRHSALPR
jgi:hypothetical protein